MSFLLSTDLEISNDAAQKIAADFIEAPHCTQVAVLLYVLKSERKSRYGEVLSTKSDFFGWGAHFVSDVPSAAIREVEGRKLAIQDGRWVQNEHLLLDVVDGQFHINLLPKGNGN